MHIEIIGAHVYLRPIVDADLHTRSEWTADSELMVLMGGNPLEVAYVSPEEELENNRVWLQNRLLEGDALYAIEADGKYIGDVDVQLYPERRKAEMTVFIGDRSAWRKGYGTESVTLILEELKTEDRFDSIEVDVTKNNDRALAFWKNLGFQEYKCDERGTHWLRRNI